MKAQDLIDVARSAIGTPFLHQGRISGKALDCAGLIIFVAHSLDIPYKDTVGYGRSPSGGLLENALSEQESLDIVQDMQPGDVLLMKFAGNPQHLALYTGSTIIHSYASVGRVCEHILDNTWKRRITCIYRFKGVSNE